MKNNTLNTKALGRIENKLVTLAKRINALVEELSTATYRIEKNHRNIVAAHKAHVTMARSKAVLDVMDPDRPIPYVLTKKGERMFKALERKEAVSRKGAKDTKKTVRHKIEIGGA